MRVVRTCAGLGEHDKACNDYSLALDIDPKNANAAHNRAASHEKAGRLEEAVSDFSLALQLGDNANTHHSLALVMDKLGRRSEALSSFGRAIELDPENPVFGETAVFATETWGYSREQLMTTPGKESCIWAWWLCNSDIGSCK